MLKIQSIIQGNRYDLDAIQHYFKEVVSIKEEKNELGLKVENIDADSEMYYILRAWGYNPEPEKSVLKVLVNGIMNLITGRTLEFGVAKLEIIDQTTDIILDSFLPNDHPKIQGKPVYDTEKVFSYMPIFDHTNTNGAEILTKSLNNEDIFRVLLWFSDSSKAWNWNNFYKAWERIASVVTQDLNIKKLKVREEACRILDIPFKEIGLLCRMANNSQDLCRGRHGKSDYDKASPNNIGLGFEITRDLIIKWLKHSYDLGVIKASLKLPSEWQYITYKEEYKTELV